MPPCRYSDLKPGNKTVHDLSSQADTGVPYFVPRLMADTCTSGVVRLFYSVSRENARSSLERLSDYAMHIFHKLRNTVFAICLGAALSGCSTGKTSDKKLEYLSALEAQNIVGDRGLLGKGQRVFVDARSEADFKAGHIPGAINLPYERVTRDHKQLESYDAIVVYGSEYNDPRAKGMSKRLIELKHDRVYTLTGGINEWKDAGNDLVAEP